MDWGASERIDENIARTLVRRTNEALSQDGITYIVTLVGGPLRSNLQLDLEVDSECEVNDDADEDIMENYDDMSLHLDEASKNERALRRKRNAMAKHRRMSVWASANDKITAVAHHQRKSLFVGFNRDASKVIDFPRDLKENNHIFNFPEINIKEEEFSPCSDALQNNTILSHIFDFLEADELLTKTSLVCTGWADISTDSYARLLLLSIECADEEDDGETSDPSTTSPACVAASMERSWKYLLENFPSASFLS